MFGKANTIAAIPKSFPSKEYFCFCETEENRVIVNFMDTNLIH
jgi:hypothetical protein